MLRKKIVFSLIIICISSVATQLVLIREAISTFGGNELVIGIVLGIWLLSMASGAYLGTLATKGKKCRQILFLGHLLLAFLPFLQVAGFRAIPLMWVRGELLGIGSVIIGSSLILFPYGLISGALIPVIAHLMAAKDAAATVYITDLGGDILGGLLFSFIFVYAFSHWQTLIVIGMANLLAALILYFPKVWSLPLTLVSALALAMLFLSPFNLSTLSWRTPGQKILLQKNTPFSQLTITQSGHQLNVLSDGLPLFSTNDYRVEAIAHIPLSQVQQDASVLLISGGVFGTLREMLKHNPSRINYVELDPAILEMDSKITGALDSPIIHTHVGDGRMFVKKAQNQGLKFDCIIVDLPDPENIQLNRFYTLEFFHEALKILGPQGVLFFTLAGADNYLEAEGLALNRSVYAALKKVFPHIILFPGETHFFLASKNLLDEKTIGNELAKRNISTQWLVDYQLPGITNPLRMDQLKQLVGEKEYPPNADLSPYAFQHLLQLWLKKSGSMKWLIPLVLFLIALFAALASQWDSKRLVTLTSGYAGISLELSLIILFQILFGYVYLWISLFVTLFMMGSLAGALSARKCRKNPLRQIRFYDFSLILLAGLVFMIAVFSKQSQSTIALSAIRYGIIPLLTFCSALAVGWQFVAVSHQLKGSAAKITGKLYLADLAGASCGTMFTSLLFLPKFGIQGVLVSIVLVKIISLVFSYSTSSFTS